MFHSHRALTALALLAALPGCCSLARLFCGPDTSPWVSEAYGTPQEAVLTVREAIKRADKAVIYRCLSEGFKERKGLPGSVEVEVAWRRLEEEFTGIHMLGYAEISGAQTLPDGRVQYVLTVSGHAFELTFDRQPYWELHWDADDEDGRYVLSLAGYTRVETDDLDGTSQVRLELPPVSMPDLTTGRIRRAGIGRVWKLDDLRPVDEESGADADDAP